MFGNVRVGSDTVEISELSVGVLSDVGRSEGLAVKAVGPCGNTDVLSGNLTFEEIVD